MLTKVQGFMAAHYMGQEPLSDDARVRELMAKTLVLGADTAEEWMNTAGVYWSTTNSTWRNLVGAHPAMDQYRVRQSSGFCWCESHATSWKLIRTLG